jgi:catechol 2,3-dioxygenase-like lactoylglutathione lyase family enzyme
MIQVRRLGHATFETPDVARQADYYAEVMGLQVARDGKRAILCTGLGEEAVIFTPGSAARLTNIALQIAPDVDLKEVGSALSAHGVKPERRSDVSPGLSSALVFADPNGTQLELYAQAKLRESQPVGGVAPLKLGHIASLGPDAKAISDFYIKALGFRVSDWIEDYFAFLRCGPEHHTLNFITGDGNFMHHIAFQLSDWNHLQKACDVLAQHKRTLIWGPGRHGVGHNVFVYHRDPDDHIIELFAEMDQMNDESLGFFEPRPWHHDHPQRPKVWERKYAAMTWGPPPTADFLRNQSRTAH